MPQMKENAFTFESRALAKDTFSVVRFSGDEGLSALYCFDILLISESADIDLTEVLQNPATFTIKSQFADGPDLPFHGILSAFEQMHQSGPYIYYRAELRPKLWWLTLTHHNQVFLDKTVDRFLSDVLKDGGLAPAVDFEFRFQGQYAPWEYVCQYGESHFAFVSRWMEREGAYYWFEQGAQSEKMIASDTRIAHAPLPGHETCLYSPPSGLDTTGADTVIKRFTLKQAPMPKNVLLKDYNYMKPGLDLEGRATVQDQGRGEIYLYGEHFPDTGEGQRLAGVRAEAYRCREKTFHGLSAIAALRPGYLFTLERHYRADFNGQYLTTTVHHEGSQARYLVSGLGVGDLEDREGLFYRNTFTCIPGDVQYRPARTTPKPRIAGTLSAKIDAAGSGRYAELDANGRYKVILPFDRSGRSGGKASAWIRMMQPYAGEGMGFHAPLHKGTEVLLSFIEADPDRPVICGAVPNAETPSPVRDANQTQIRLVSGSGNVMHMEDKAGSERILMHSPAANTFLRLGAPNDPDTAAGHQGDNHEAQPEEEETEWGARLVTDKLLKIQAGGENTVILGECIETVVGVDLGIKLINTDEIIGGIKTEVMMGGQGSYTPLVHWHLKGSEEKVAATEMKVIAAKQDALGTYEVVEGEQGRVTATLTAVTAEAARAVGDSIDVTGAVTTAVGTQTEALGEQIRAAVSQTTALGERVQALGTCVRTVGSQLSNAGTCLRNAGSDMSNSGTRIDNAGTALQNASIAIRDAPIIMDN
ncbi:type VI secretion system Vgr family protein [Desulfatitalea alkaliphila]|uniref:Type VI secretion system tip protein VgrG n=1 Tax=Desulfatitalea alkaliphila TaxID=2929485 RepID=A0AA41UJX7_9BACT|nr:type VI secretion system tip protein TssI/VgrG [Desulfatitalea alkaliphila]MCJ8502440.1 type VI secretion system tip protein VgrG [Desulfatitalea alkaliphila]